MNKILELLNQDNQLLYSVFWKKSFTKGLNELNNPNSEIGKKLKEFNVNWFLETEENAMRFLGLLPEGEVVYLNDDMDITPLADELFLTPFTIFLYNTDDETSVSIIKKTYINTGLSKYVEDLIQYTQWCRENGYNVDDYEIITEIEKNLKTSLK